jgi:hypothetical protein
VALAALFLSIIISFLTIQLFIPADENPVIGGLFWLFALLVEGTLLVPLNVAITAELVERRVSTSLRPVFMEFSEYFHLS